MKPERESSIARPGQFLGKAVPGDGRAEWIGLVKRWRLASESLYDVRRTSVDNDFYKSVTGFRGRDRMKGESQRKMCRNKRISEPSPAERVKEGNLVP